MPATLHWWSLEIAETDANSPYQIIWPVSSLVSSGVQLRIIQYLADMSLKRNFSCPFVHGELHMKLPPELTGLSEPCASQVKQFQSPVLTLDTFEDYAPCWKQSCKGSIQFDQFVSRLGHQIHRSQGLWRPMASNTSSLFCFNRWWRAKYSVRTHGCMMLHFNGFQSVLVSKLSKYVMISQMLWIHVVNVRMYMRVHVVHCAALILGSVDSCDSVRRTSFAHDMTRWVI